MPTTTISAAPTGGGTSYEAVNLLTPKRINTFIGNGSATQFQVDAKDLDDTTVTAAVDGEAVTVSSVNRSTGLVTLASAPPNGNGLANVSISFSKTVDGYADKINQCSIAGLYGGKNDTRVFLTGNPDEPNCDWQSGLYDPTYFPDTGLHPHGNGCFCDRRLPQAVREPAGHQVGRRTGGNQLSALLPDGRRRHGALSAQAGRAGRRRGCTAQLRHAE